LGRINLIFTWFILSVVRLSAQSGGYSNLEFVENKGQWDTSVRYRALMSAGSFIMGRGGFLVTQHDTNDLRRISVLIHGGQAGAPMGGGGASVKAGGKGGAEVTKDRYRLHSHSYKVSFENANPQAQIIPEKPLSTYNNYFVGDRSHWATGCRIYQGVTYKDIYPGVDVHYYTNAGFLKYDLVVHPGADVSKVVLRYEGQDGLAIKKNQLHVKTSVGTVRELEPLSYQVNGEGRKDVPCKYVIRDGNRVGFSPGAYSSDATLVIDPTEVFCTFTGSRSDNWGYTATYDNQGNFYAGGIAINYPDESGSLYGATPGAFQSTFQGGDSAEGGEYQNGVLVYAYQFDVGIMKFNASGSNKVFATYLGGSGDEQPHSMICDAQGDLIVTGRTSSKNFPRVPANDSVGEGNTHSGVDDFDVYVTKFNPTGTGVIGSHRIGGTGDDGLNNSPKYKNAYGRGTQELRLNYGDDSRGEVILDGAGNIYVATSTRSTNFYTTAGAYQPACSNASTNDQDGVVVKFSPDVSTILASTYLGGSKADAPFVLAINPTTSNVYVAGGTLSSDFPMGTGAGTPLNAAALGGVDGFISILTPDLGTLIKSTYFGTATTDIIYGLDFDKYGYCYIAGTTYSYIPVVNSPFNQGSGASQSQGHQFITKLQPDLSAIVYSANFGPEGNAYPSISEVAFLVDRCENVYVSGWGGSIDPGEGYNNAGVAGLVTTSGAIKPNTDADHADFYFFVLQRNASAQLYGTFFGQVNGNLGDHVDGGTSRFDSQGVIYEAICANCDGGAVFPTTVGAYAKVNGAVSFGGCNEAAVKIAFNFAGVSAGLKAVTHGRGDSVGCVPLDATFSDTIRDAKSYVWNFGDGTPSLATTSYTENHTYPTVGTYLVTLVAIDSTTCNIADTVTHTIIVENNPAYLDFRYDKIGVCTDSDYLFTNLSTVGPAAPPFSDTAFTWSFGDGTILPDVSLGTKPTHPYGAPGPYNVTLTLNDTSYCNYPLDTVKLLYVAQNVKASFSTPAIGCAPDTAVFTNTSIAGQKFYWYFGDGSPVDSSDVSPVHVYPNVGTYTVEMVAVDSTTCNIIDSTSFTITIMGKPTAAFTYSPQSPQPANTPTVFTNESVGGVKFQWFFGDGSSETKTTTDTVVHQYNMTDTFEVCLAVTNASGCIDTACQAVSALVNPLLDVPNAFTPGRFGENAIIKVVGFGITHMDWRIYNRWGQLVFESVDPNVGWDGTYKGTVQPMDVYGYTLEADFSNNSHVTKKGDITLIR
jgi:gliding motility-associated-like protein